MVRLSAAVTLIALLVAGTISTASQRARQTAAVTVRASQEMAPPGGMAQMKIRVTDAVPIFTGSAKFSFPGMAAIEGISVVSPADDGAAGIAVVRGTDVALSIVSSNGTLG